MIMNADTLTKKICDLEMEYLKGQNRLGALQSEVRQVESGLNRIEGAIKACQELREELNAAPAPEPPKQAHTVAEAMPAEAEPEPGTDAAEKRRLRK